jgi:uncharacterized membrane protein YkvA (DUF1232 family)
VATTTERLKQAARRLRRDAILLWLAARDPRVPWAPKLLAAMVAAYAFSPIDLIPDPCPSSACWTSFCCCPAWCGWRCA